MRLSETASKSWDLKNLEPRSQISGPPGGRVKSLWDSALKTVGPSRVDFRKTEGPGVRKRYSDATRNEKKPLIVLKNPAFQRFFAVWNMKTGTGTGVKNFCGNGKNLDEFRVFFEFFCWFLFQFDAIRRVRG